MSSSDARRVAQLERQVRDLLRQRQQQWVYPGRGGKNEIVSISIVAGVGAGQTIGTYPGVGTCYGVLRGGYPTIPAGALLSGDTALPAGMGRGVLGSSRVWVSLGPDSSLTTAALEGCTYLCAAKVQLARDGGGSETAWVLGL